MTDTTDIAAKKKTGFALMDRTEVSALAQKGGRSAHAMGAAHEFTSEEARAAGRKGGLAGGARKRQAKLRELALAAGNIGKTE